MGRTLPSGTMQFIIEQNSFEPFKQALRRSDQLILDDLFASAHNHIAAISYASSALTGETILLAMLLEEHKKVMKLESMIERLEDQTKA
jgi:hypothetical protein